MTERLAPGELLGSTLDDRYLLHEEVGRGGMAVVYRAWDKQLHRPVAIKLLRNDSDSASEAHRRVKEARALAAINHPALVTLFDAVIRDDRSYLVMELVEGHTLRTEIAAGRLEPREVALIARDIADGLRAVHAAGIIHRDIKPPNILLAPSTFPEQRFRAKLSDFGIAHFVDTTRVTSPGLFLGTANYVSPEQAHGHPPVAASDIYALGLTLLESLVGEPAFVGSALEVVAARLSRDPNVPSELGPEWSKLLVSMTARDPAARPTAREVASAARAISALGTQTLEVSLETAPFAAPEIPHAATRDSTTVADQTLDATRRLPAPSVSDDALLRPRGAARQRARQKILLLAGGAVGILLIGAGIFLVPALATAEAPAPTSTPTLPSLAPPLDEDMRDLLEQVSP